jgi:hypothetical protein
MSTNVYASKAKQSGLRRSYDPMSIPAGILRYLICERQIWLEVSGAGGNLVAERDKWYMFSDARSSTTVTALGFWRQTKKRY